VEAHERRVCGKNTFAQGGIIKEKRNMQIDINASKIDMTPSLKKYAEMKIGALGKFVKKFEKDTESKIYLELARSSKHHKHGDVFYAEATLRIPGKTLRAQHMHSDIRAAIDVVRDTLSREVVKFKGTKKKTQVRKIRRAEK
jgi:putative sigma-54 modulation protein